MCVSRMFRALSAACVAAAILVHPSFAWSQSATAGSNPSGEQGPQTSPPVVSAEQPSPPPENAVPRRGMTATWQDGLSIETSDGDYQVRIGALVRLDGRFAMNAAPGAPANTFTMRTVRANIQGRITRYFTYRLVPDFLSTTSLVADAYVDIGLSSAMHLRIGRDKTPTGFEALLGDANVLFMERGLTLNLMPGRDVGVQVYGDAPGGVVSYAGSIFNGTADGTTAGNLDTDNGKELVGRTVVRPFTRAGPSALHKLGVALAGTWEHQHGALPSFRTSVQQPYFAYAAGATADGLHTRISPQIFHYYKSFSLYTEYARSRQAVRKAAAGAVVTNRVWQVAGSFLLTGETAGERVHPKRTFDPENHTWGALQVMARYGSMTLDPTIFALGLADGGSSRQVQVATVGAIWFLTTNVKSLLDVERTAFDRNQPGARDTEHSILFRLQLNF